MEQKIEKYIKEALINLYNANAKDLKINIEKTKKGIDGHYTVIVFPFVKISKKNPQETAKELGVYIKSRFNDISSFNVIKGFLNLKMTSEYWISILNQLSKQGFNQLFPDKEKKYMIEFSSPNTNKPLHLGHIRNNLLGESISRILNINGYEVTKTNLINDRGIHICKTIFAWINWADGKTPESENIKGDKFVGNLYVMFEKEYKNQINDLINKGSSKENAEKNAPLIIEAREILRKWESGDPEIMKIWNMMNGWVYNGFDETYKRLGVNFDIVDYESETYLIGKEIVKEGLEKGIFHKEQDNSIWIDFKKEGFEKKLILRADGTTVYMTQDIGTAFKRFKNTDPDKILYVVGNEQNYHFKVLKEIISRFDNDLSDKIQHLSYGMVELPDGKMKSREGKVVDADDLLDEMIKTATEISNESGRLHELPTNEQNKTIETIALGALKYFILKVDPSKNMVFNPTESIDFNGNTGPFIQYTHARICSVFRNADKMRIKFTGKLSEETRVADKEVSLISALVNYKYILQSSAKNLDPGLIANYIYELVKEYNQFYHDHSILKEKDSKILQMRLVLSQQVANTIKSGMELLGIEVPEIM